MPHFGLMSTKESFDNAEGALQRARLHIRGGRRRLMQGKISAGIITLYDALIFALRFYLMVPEHREEFRVNAPVDLTDEKAMLRLLRESGIVDASFDLDEFEALVDKAAAEDIAVYDYMPVLNSFESLMTLLEVMPFDESLLPAEDPSTF